MSSSLYQQLFPNPKEDVTLSPDQFSQLKESLSRQFDLAVIDENVQSLLRQFQPNIQNVFFAYNGDFGLESSFIYDYDGLLYRATVSVEPVSSGGEKKTNYHLRLANGGFLYLPDQAYSCRRTNVKRYDGSKNWSELVPTTCNYLPNITTYATFFLGDYLGKQFFYSSESARMDIRFLSADRKRCLTFSFEPGDPEDLFEDFTFDQMSLKREGA